MNAIYGLLISMCCLWIGWMLGRNRGQNDRQQVACADCVIHKRYESAKADIAALDEQLQTSKRRCAQLVGQNQRLLGKIHYQNSFMVER